MMKIETAMGYKKPAYVSWQFLFKKKTLTVNMCCDIIQKNNIITNITNNRKY